MSQTFTPSVRWAQRKDHLYIKIDISDLQKPNIQLEESKLTFQATVEKKNYQVVLEFFKEVNPKESKWDVKPRYVEFYIKKKESGPYWERLIKSSEKLTFLKVDWNHWKDEDEDEDDEMGDDFGGNNFNMDNMDVGGESSSDDEASPDLEKDEKEKEEKEEESEKQSTELEKKEAS